MNGKKAHLTGNNGDSGIVTYSAKGHFLFFIRLLMAFCSRWINRIVLKSNSYVEIYLRNPGCVTPFLTFLKNSSSVRFGSLMDILGVDFPEKTNRFEIVYCLLSMKNNIRFLVKVETSDDLPLNSIINLYPSANWLEREVWDMFGVFFFGHPDLRRILTDYGFDGFPLRKDFPTIGYFEVRYDEETKKIVTEPVETNQEYRVFDFSNPWNHGGRIGS
jgi:NADH/F420H2 dehydrogenase subunit C